MAQTGVIRGRTTYTSDGGGTTAQGFNNGFNGKGKTGTSMGNVSNVVSKVPYIGNSLANSMRNATRTRTTTDYDGGGGGYGGGGARGRH